MASAKIFNLILIMMNTIYDLHHRLELDDQIVCGGRSALYNGSPLITASIKTLIPTSHLRVCVVFVGEHECVQCGCARLFIISMCDSVCSVCL